MTPVARIALDGARDSPYRLVPGRVDGTTRVVDRRPATGQSYARDGLADKGQAMHSARGGALLISNTEQQILLLRAP